jgi:hypothetical protein
VTIRDLNRELDWQLPDEHASTVAGLVLYESRRIPMVGQVFVFFGFRFEILERHRNQITKLKITPIVDDKSGKPQTPAGETDDRKRDSDAKAVVKVGPKSDPGKKSGGGAAGAAA